MNKSSVTVAIFATILILFGLIFYINKEKTEGNENYAVVVKENPGNTALSDIYLHDIKDAADMTKDKLFITTGSVNRNHYHVAEYHDGNVYLIKRTGEDLGNYQNKNWTDELWKYDSKKRATKLFSVKGLDYRVSADGEKVAIFYTDPNITDKGVIAITFLKGDGSLIKTFTAKELDFEKYEAYVYPIFWAKDTMWLTAGGGPKINVIAKIDTAASFAVTKFDVADLPLQLMEFSLNPDRELVAFSDFPIIFDADSAEEFAASKKPVTLYTYNLATKEKQTIATSVAKNFAPVWLDPNTLEHNNPEAEGRMIKVLE